MNDDLDIDYGEIVEDREFVAQNPGVRPDIETNLTRLDNAVDLIGNTPPEQWTNGIGSDLPYGFGTASCVRTDQATIIQYEACGVATVIQVDSSPDPNSPNGSIYFGTTLATDGQGICVKTTCN